MATVLQTREASPGIETFNENFDQDAQKPAVGAVKQRLRRCTKQVLRVCEVCKKAFTTSYGLKRHTLIHSDERPHSCKVCGKSFRLLHHLKGHACIRIDRNKYSGGAATQNQQENLEVMDQQKDLEEMVLSEHLELIGQKDLEKYERKCRLCNKTFAELIGLMQHISEYSNKPPPCQVCGKTFILWHQYQFHLCVKPSEKNLGDVVKMPDCQTGERNSPHIKNIWSCKICGLNFVSKFKYKQHASFHITRKVGNREISNQSDTMRTETLFCKICSKTFATENTLQRHTATHDPSLPKPPVKKNFLCEICGKLFQNNCLLREHHQSHSNENKWQCEICGKSFSKKSNLVTHGYVHEDKPARNFVCHLCGKGFRVPFCLKLHMRVHTKEKPFICDICGKRYPYRYCLESHRHTHSNVKAFACFCGRSFKTPFSLTAHRRHSHTDKDKRFSCTLCNKTFSELSTLKGHYITHTNEKPWKCRLCGMRFADRKLFKLHKELCT